MEKNSTNLEGVVNELNKKSDHKEKIREAKIKTYLAKNSLPADTSIDNVKTHSETYRSPQRKDYSLELNPPGFKILAKLFSNNELEINSLHKTPSLLTKELVEGVENINEYMQKEHKPEKITLTIIDYLTKGRKELPKDYKSLKKIVTTTYYEKIDKIHDYWEKDLHDKPRKKFKAEELGYAVKRGFAAYINYSGLKRGVIVYPDGKFYDYLKDKSEEPINNILNSKVKPGINKSPTNSFFYFIQLLIKGKITFWSYQTKKNSK